MRPCWRKICSIKNVWTARKPTRIAIATTHPSCSPSAAKSAGSSCVEGTSPIRLATASNATLRTTVAGPIGADATCPKQRHDGFFPSARLTTIAAVNAASRKNAAAPPQRALAVGTSAIAMMSWASGSTRAIVPAEPRGKPKSQHLRGPYGVAEFRDSRDREDDREKRARREHHASKGKAHWIQFPGAVQPRLPQHIWPDVQHCLVAGQQVVFGGQHIPGEYWHGTKTG